MSDLSCIVFIADALEPNRGDTPELTPYDNSAIKISIKAFDKPAIIP